MVQPETQVTDANEVPYGVSHLCHFRRVLVLFLVNVLIVFEQCVRCGFDELLHRPVFGAHHFRDDGGGFEANLADLQQLADINEGYCINADSEDVV